MDGAQLSRVIYCTAMPGTEVPGKKRQASSRRGSAFHVRIRGIFNTRRARALKAFAVRRTPIPVPGVFNTRLCETAKSAFCIVSEGHGRNAIEPGNLLHDSSGSPLRGLLSEFAKSQRRTGFNPSEADSVLLIVKAPFGSCCLSLSARVPYFVVQYEGSHRLSRQSEPEGSAILSTRANLYRT